MSRLFRRSRRSRRDSQESLPDVNLLQKGIAEPLEAERMPDNARPDFFITQAKLNIRFRPEEDEEALLLQWLNERGFVDVVAVPYEPSELKKMMRQGDGDSHSGSYGLDICIWVSDERIIRSAIVRDPQSPLFHPRTLSPEERAALVEDAMQELIEARQLGMVSYHKLAPLHDVKKLAEVKHACSVILVTSKCLDPIFRYFGSHVAFFFAWVHFSTVGMCFPALYGGYMWLKHQSDGRFVLDREPTRYLGIVTSLLLASWGFVSLQFWKRYSSELAYKWGVYGADASKKNMLLVKRHYLGKTYSIYVLGDTGWEALYKMRMLLTFTLELMVLASGIILAALFIRLEGHLIVGEMVLSSQAVLLLYATTPLLLAPFHRKMAEITTAWEGHIDTNWAADILVLKLFAFEFVFSYSAPLYYALWGRDFARLEVTIFALMVTRLLGKLASELAGHHFRKLLLRVWDLAEQRKSKRISKVIETKCRLGEALPGVDKSFSYSQMYNQRHRRSFDTREEFLEFIMHYGYVCMFAVALPWVPLVAIVGNFIAFRYGAYKACVSIRPRYETRSSIGSWLSVLEFIVGCSIITNGSILSMVSPGAWEDHIPDGIMSIFTKRVLMTIIFGHTLLLSKYVLKGIVGNISTSTESMMAEEALEDYFRLRNARLEELGMSDLPFLSRSTGSSKQKGKSTSLLKRPTSWRDSSSPPSKSRLVSSHFNGSA